MVDLIPQSYLDRFNIDTVERAIVFSTLVLQSAIARVPDNFRLRQKIKLNFSKTRDNDVSLNIDVSLPFNLDLFASSGGNLLLGVTEFDLKDTTLIGSYLRYTNILESYPKEPIIPQYFGLQSFEQYLYYYTAILSVSLPKNLSQIVTIDLRTNGIEGGELRLKAILPLMSNIVSKHSSLLGSVGRVTDNYINISDTTIDDKISFILRNETILTNDVILTNGIEMGSNMLSNNTSLTNDTLLVN